MTTLKSGFKYPWLIALSLALFSCAQTNIERDASNENGGSAVRSHGGYGSLWAGTNTPHDDMLRN